MPAARGDSLLMIGALLGHKNTTTTSRYAHLGDDPQRAAADGIASDIASAMGLTNGDDAEVVPLHRGER